MKGRAGRKRKSGERHACGKRKAVYDYGCEGVVRRRQANSLIAANESGAIKIVADESFDALGRAWAAGLLTIEGKDPAVVRDAGRSVAALYWRWARETLTTGALDSLARFQPSVGGLVGQDRDQALETALNNRIAMIDALGRDVRRAFDHLCIDFYPDFGPTWIDRLIAAERGGRARVPGDDRMLALALRGLTALV